MPGISKTFSISTDPANISVKMLPKPVAMGISEFLKAWAQMARLNVAPLASTVRT